MADTAEERDHLLELGDGHAGHEVAFLVHGSRGLRLRQRLQQPARVLDPHPCRLLHLVVPVPLPQRQWGRFSHRNQPMSKGSYYGTPWQWRMAMEMKP
jgi:hypothetical protein